MQDSKSAGTSTMSPVPPLAAPLLQPLGRITHIPTSSASPPMTTPAIVPGLIDSLVSPDPPCTLNTPAPAHTAAGAQRLTGQLRWPDTGQERAILRGALRVISSCSLEQGSVEMCTGDGYQRLLVLNQSHWVHTEDTLSRLHSSTSHAHNSMQS